MRCRCDPVLSLLQGLAGRPAGHTLAVASGAESLRDSLWRSTSQDKRGAGKGRDQTGGQGRPEHDQHGQAFLL